MLCLLLSPMLFPCWASPTPLFWKPLKKKNKPFSWAYYQKTLFRTLHKLQCAISLRWCNFMLICFPFLCALKKKSNIYWLALPKIIRRQLYSIFHANAPYKLIICCIIYVQSYLLLVCVFKMHQQKLIHTHLHNLKLTCIGFIAGQKLLKNRDMKGLILYGTKVPSVALRCWVPSASTHFRDKTREFEGYLPSLLYDTALVISQCLNLRTAHWP